MYERSWYFNYGQVCADNLQDDRITFNTQTSSQWDGLRHWGFDDGRFYNGLTQDEILGGKTSRLGINGESLAAFLES